MAESIDQRELRDAARALVEADVTVALTGAGASTESGVPDFRSDGGIWEKYDEREFTITRFHSDPGGFWEDWLELQRALVPETADPNPAHRSLAALESAGHVDAVITQNVDGLHQQADTRTVIEIHGNGDRAVCRGCEASFDAAVVEERARSRDDGPPRCENCGDVLKPDVVLFGERLPDIPIREAQRLARRSDAMLVVGTSLTVEPAGSLPERATASGATVVVVNDEPTAVADLVDYSFRGRAGSVLPELASAAVDVQ
jgi:NAD-dependent deacetylase